MKKRKLLLRRIVRLVGRVARFLLKSQLLTVFLALCILGLWVGLQTRPDPRLIPHAELFDNMGVASFRDSPADSGAHFLVELSAGGKVFSRYEVDARRFLPPERGRTYNRAITGTRYAPLRMRGHVAEGFWLELQGAAGPTLVPEQLDELYRTTLGYLKPVSILTQVLGTLSGYSVGYRLGTWSGSLCNPRVQQRVVGTPGLGRTIALEAWRRVLLEPVVMADENDAARFTAVHGTHRLYANFLRVALNDSDGFIPHEAKRLAGLGRTHESRAMLGFVEAVRRAAQDTVHLGSADFDAVERWASLLDRRGHWAHGTIPPPGEERVRYLGALAWYGLAPPPPDIRRVWVGPRMLVREGETEGFVADEIPATGVGCPISWRDGLHDGKRATSARASAWLADRPEFVALATLGGRVAREVVEAARRVAVRPHRSRPSPLAATGSATTAAFASRETGAETPAASHASPGRSLSRSPGSMDTCGSIILATEDPAGTARHARVAQATIARVDSLLARWSAASGAPPPGREGEAHRLAPEPEVTTVVAAALHAWRGGDGALDAAVEPIVRAWGLIGSPRRLASKPDSVAGAAGAGTISLDPPDHGPGFDPSRVKAVIRGLARGQAVDAAADSLEARGVRNALIDDSGTLFALGAPALGERWRIGIPDPHDRMPCMARLQLAAHQGMSTYGPGTGPLLGPAAGGGLLSATVIAPNAMTAAAWSTALFALGPADARRKARERADLSAILVERGADGVDTVWVEADLEDRITLEAQGRARFRVELF